MDRGVEVEEESEDVLRDALRGVSRDIADGDVACAGSVEVDDIVAGGSNEDEFEVGESRDGFGAEWDFVCDEDFGAGCMSEDVVAGSGVVVSEFTEGFEGGEVEVVASGGGGIEEGGSWFGIHNGKRSGMFSGEVFCSSERMEVAESLSHGVNS